MCGQSFTYRTPSLREIRLIRFFIRPGTIRSGYMIPANQIVFSSRMALPVSVFPHPSWFFGFEFRLQDCESKKTKSVSAFTPRVLRGDEASTKEGCLTIFVSPLLIGSRETSTPLTQAWRASFPDGVQNSSIPPAHASQGVGDGVGV